MNIKTSRLLLAAAMLASLQLVSGCTGLPEGIKPVTGFEVSSYMGRWYEIARLDHSFERGQTNVTADYALREDGTVSVLNRGFDQAEGEWREASAVARFAGATDVGHLEVSFFRPIYASYVIFELGADGDYAFVTGHKRDYLWLLSRSPRIPQALKARFLQQVTALGFAADGLIWVDQDKH